MIVDVRTDKPEERIESINFNSAVASAGDAPASKLKVAKDFMAAGPAQTGRRSVSYVRSSLS